MPILTHLVAILSLAALCAGWVLFQRWLKRADPHGRGIEDATGCSGDCRRERGRDRQWDATDGKAPRRPHEIELLRPETARPLDHRRPSHSGPRGMP